MQPDDATAVGRDDGFRITIDGRRAHVVVAVVLCLFGVAFAWQASLLDFGTRDAPGPGFIPFVLGAGVALCGAGLAFTELRAPAHGERVSFAQRDVLFTLALMVCAALAFERLGAVATVALYLMASLVLLARVKWWVAVPSAFALTAGFALFFGRLLGVQLPAGPF